MSGVGLRHVATLGRRGHDPSLLKSGHGLEGSSSTHRASAMDEKKMELTVQKRAQFLVSLVSRHPNLDSDFVRSLFLDEDMLASTPKRKWERKAGRARQLCRLLNEGPSSVILKASCAS